MRQNDNTSCGFFCLHYIEELCRRKLGLGYNLLYIDMKARADRIQKLKEHVLPQLPKGLGETGKASLTPRLGTKASPTPSFLSHSLLSLLLLFLTLFFLAWRRSFCKGLGIVFVNLGPKKKIC